MSKWKLEFVDSKTKGNSIYFNIKKDGKDFGFVNFFPNGEIVIEVNAYKIECPCKEETHTFAEEGKAIRKLNMTTYWTELTDKIKESIGKLKPEEKKGAVVIRESTSTEHLEE